MATTEAVTSKWAQPAAVSDVLLVFPASVAGLLPEMADLPDDFRREASPWCKLVADWFYRGLNGSFVWRDGIDGTAALRHLSVCMGSFEPKHERKMAGVAYLLSLWAERFEPAPQP